MQHPSTDYITEQKNSAPSSRAVHRFRDESQKILRQPLDIQGLESGNKTVSEQSVPPHVVTPQANIQQATTQRAATQQRGWRPLYEIIDDGSLQSSVKSQAVVKPSPPDKPRISLLIACIISAFASSIVSISGYHAMMAESDPPAVILHSPLAPEPTVTPAPTATAAPVTIFVSGSVRNIGVYELPVGARIEDAIEQAGGLSDEADPERVNRAMKLFDGAQIHIPSRAPLKSNAEVRTQPEIPPPPIGLSGTDVPPSAGDSSSNATGTININSASQSAIESLPGIGASKAKEIIAGRPYSSVDDLQKVSGIGAKTVDQLREFIVVE